MDSSENFDVDKEHPINKIKTLSTILLEKIDEIEKMIKDKMEE